MRYYFLGRIEVFRKGETGMTLFQKLGMEEFLKRIEAKTTGQPLFTWLGARVVSVNEGSCEMELRVREELMNDRGTLQGTVLYALLDAATFVASRTLAKDRRELDFHQEMKLNFIKALRDMNQVIRVKARALHRGRSTAVVEGEIVTEAGELVAKALGTIAILRPHE
jgi:uncharacterized protein (TIGR00369 family)